MTPRLGFAALLAALFAGPTLACKNAAACPFCVTQGQTFTGEIAASDFIVLGKLSNAKRDPDDFTKGTTTLTIESVVKPHDYLAGKKTITIPQYRPTDPKNPDAKILVFFLLNVRASDMATAALTSPLAIAKGDAVQLDAVRGQAVEADSKLPEYLTGAIKIRSKPAAERLAFFFSYLDASDLLVSGDAFGEFAGTEYPDVRKVAEKLPAKKVFDWLADPNTLPSRLGLYGLMAGHCGKPSDAAKIRALLDDQHNRFLSGFDGLLTAYIMLDKENGWRYLLEILAKPETEFQQRYSVLKVLRFLWEFRPDVVGHDQVLGAMKQLIKQADMADLPIEDLRKWKRFEMTADIVKLADSPEHNTVPITRRAILRFAVSAPVEQTAAKEYVERVRKLDPERVKYVEQSVKDDDAANAKPSSDPAAKPNPMK